MDPRGDKPVLEMRKVSMAFQKRSGEPLDVLSGIDLTVRDGEILGLLGRSGCGKSTLLRIAAGLLHPTRGEVLYQGKPVTGPPPGLALVFQTFALLPWLTVQQNVEAALDAIGVDRKTAGTKAQAAIDLIGLDGFEAAYPRELSGGMRQRVGFARATVIDPTLLLMDEPFSALDVLTAETLRTDFIDLWTSGKLPIRSVLMVTHNIEEAVSMCDRILVLAPNPGRIAAEAPVPLAQPRDRQDQGFREVVDRIYAILTSRAVQAAAGGPAAAPAGLPAARIPDIARVAELLAAPPYDGQADLSDLARTHSFHSAGGVMPVAKALHLLEFAELGDGRLRITAAGRVFASADHDQRKRLFREHLTRFAPLAEHIVMVLKERGGKPAPRRRFEVELEDHLGRADAEAALTTMIAWGRYAELFTYDDHRRTFTATTA